VIFDAAGDLYGATYNGGANGDGTIFKLATAASVPGPTSLLLLGLGMAAPGARVARTRRSWSAGRGGNGAA
jgi:uncharacterized repeat protein (TIGR03803 family)